MKGFIRVRRKEMLGITAGSARQFRAFGQNFIQQLAVMGSNVFNVADVFVAPFNFERAHAGIHQITQVGGLVVVFHRQQMFVVRHHAAGIVF